LKLGCRLKQLNALVVELVDTLDLKSNGWRDHPGSIPGEGTIMLIRIPIGWLGTRYKWLGIGLRFDVTSGYRGAFKWEPRIIVGRYDYYFGETDFFGDEP
jgi:hypothetical protein